MRQRRRVLLVLVALAALAAGVVPAAQANHSWGGYHWARTTSSFDLLVGNNVDGSWQASFDGALADWTQSAVVNLTETTGGTKPRQCKTTEGRVEVCNERYGNTGWLGVAGISITGGEHITAGYVKLNDSYFSSTTYDTPAWRALVACQEIGHTLGLDHQDENFDNANLGTCMDYTNDPSTNQHPNTHDYQQLADIYAHTDTFNSYDDGSATGGGGGGGGKGGPPSGKGGPNHGNADASAWGREVASNGHTSTFVRHDGDTTWVTHVIWAR